MSFGVNQVFTYVPQLNQGQLSQNANISCVLPQSKEAVLNSATASSLKLDKILEELSKFRCLLTELEAVKNDFEMADLLQATLDYKLPPLQNFRIEQQRECAQTEEREEDQSENVMVIHTDPQVIEINDDSLSNKDQNKENAVADNEKSIKIEAADDKVKVKDHKDESAKIKETSKRTKTVKENSVTGKRKDSNENEETKNNVTATEKEIDEQQESVKDDVKRRYGKKQDNGRFIFNRNYQTYV